MRTQSEKKAPKRRGLKLRLVFSTPPVSEACRLDRLADAELQHGHHARAEHLAQLAAALREVRA